MKAAVGIALVVAHVAAFVAIAARTRGTELVLTDGKPPPSLAHRVITAEDGTRPGLAHRTYSVTYRGGHQRRVGVTELVGPFQDPAARACTGRVVVGQRLLDEGVADVTRAELEAQLAGVGFVGIGDYERTTSLSLRWAELRAHPEDQTLMPAAPFGYVRITATILFERVTVELVVALAPLPATEMSFDVHTRAKLTFDNGVVQWLSDHLGGDNLATWIARRELDRALLTTLAPPPPIGPLTFTYCDGAPEIIDGVSGALPFAVLLGGTTASRRGPTPRAPLTPGAAAALDLDLDALNAMLYELWRTGDLEPRLAGLATRFNQDPLVQRLLSIRLSPPRLPYPPVLYPTATGLRMASEAHVVVGPTVGRIWGVVDIGFAPSSWVRLHALELTCERVPTVLVPCYADLVAAVRDRGDDFHGELTRSLDALLEDLFVGRRVSAPGVPADLLIRSATPRLTLAAQNASLHIDLDAHLSSSTTLPP